MIGCCRTQVPSLRQPGRTNGHPEDAGGLLVIASRSDVSVGQFGAHDWIAPAGLLGALGVNGFGFDQASGRHRFAQCFRRRVRAHRTPPALRIEPPERGHECIAANVGAEGLDVAVAGQSLEGGRNRLEAYKNYTREAFR